MCMHFLGKYFFFGLIVIGVLSGCEYRDHYLYEQKSRIPKVSLLSEKPTVLTGGEIYLLPDLSVLDSLKQTIQKSRSRVWIEVYTWTEKSILDEVIIAKRRGVDVRVILEGNVFGLPEINTPHLRLLQKANIPVVFSDNDRFTFTHAKFWIVDDEYYISTGNLSYSAFSKNRELIYKGKDSQTRTKLESVFEADFDHSPTDIEPVWALLIGPEYMRLPIENLFSTAKKSITLYIQALSDDRMIRILEDISNKWIQVRICVADKWEGDDAFEEIEMAFSWGTIQYKKIKKPYPHIKFFLLDGETAFIGSTNFTKNALDNNREVGILFTLDTEKTDILWRIPKSECHLLK